MGWDTTGFERGFAASLFQSTHPVWDGTRPSCFPRKSASHFNPPIPCGMGLATRSRRVCQTHISIHPSRVGWDRRPRAFAHADKHFNPPIPCGMGRFLPHNLAQFLAISIHPSRVGWDFSKLFYKKNVKIFQSTHPVWDGTSTRTQKQTATKDFNPPIPCGMGLSTILLCAVDFRFQSTHPVWDGTRSVVCREL